MKGPDVLRKYRSKRAFDKTPEPRGGRNQQSTGSFVVQRHSARRLHYDFRLEVEGTLKSWAVPKGPPLAGAEKRLAIQVEDHPLEYAKFEGEIPKGNYGAGDVKIWDRGTFQTEGTETAQTQIANGEIKFRLNGTRLRGRYVLVKLRNSARKNEWLFIRKVDDASAAEAKRPHSSLRISKIKSPNPIADPSTLAGAVRAPMPAEIKVALASPAETPFSDKAWLFEIKWDGERAIAWSNDGSVEIRSRSKREITGEYPELQELARRLSARQAIVDGEIVALDESGRSDFAKLQARFGVRNPSTALLAQAPVVFYVFDILHCDGFDLRNAPLIERKNLLQRLLNPSATIRYSDHQVEKGLELFDLARRQGLEGLVAKKIDSPYISGRTRLWLKLKIVQELDVVIGGFTAPRRTRDNFGALLMGLYRGKDLQYVGSVGTGFDQQSLARIHSRLRKLASRKSPFAVPPKLKEKITWVEPSLVARVKYGEWTPDLKLRHPVFLGFRDDSDPSNATFDEQTGAVHKSTKTSAQAKHHAGKWASPASKPENDEQRKKASAPRAVLARDKAIEETAELENELANGSANNMSAILNGQEVALSNLNKIYFPARGIKKRTLLLHYLRVAEYILPFLQDRPLVLKRYPNGVDGKFFFQKEAPQSRPSWMRTVSVYSNERSANIEYFVADDLAALLYLTNLGCIDHNPWSSRTETLDNPDYVFFDLDPTDGTEFDAVVEVAKATEACLTRLGMKSFPKTSGATGLHIFIPLEPNYSYEQVQMFAAAVAEMVRQKQPELVTLERIVKKRKKGTVLIDTLQNARGKPLAAVYSVRPVASAAVATPISGRELNGKLRPDAWDIATISIRLKKTGDLWRDFWKHRQRLESAVNRSERH